jgi:hypothetical protein
MERWLNDTDKEKSKYLEKNHSVIEPTTNPKWTSLVMNPR